VKQGREEKKNDNIEKRKVYKMRRMFMFWMSWRECIYDGGIKLKGNQNWISLFWRPSKDLILIGMSGKRDIHVLLEQQWMKTKTSSVTQKPC